MLLSVVLSVVIVVVVVVVVVVAVVVVAVVVVSLWGWYLSFSIPLPTLGPYSNAAQRTFQFQR